MEIHREYEVGLSNKILGILSRKEKSELTYDLLDTEKSKRHKLIALQVKHRQMKIGEIWQEVLGNYYGCINLKVGDATGLDIVSHSKKFIVELKNRTNTDNASSKKTNFDKLAKYKTEHPDYTCIYGNINAATEEETTSGSLKKILHNDVEILHMSGSVFLEYILGNDTVMVVNFVKNIVEEYDNDS